MRVARIIRTDLQGARVAEVDLVAAINAIPIDEIRQRIAEAQHMTGAEIEARQRRERHARAEKAAAALRDDAEVIPGLLELLQREAAWNSPSS